MPRQFQGPLGPPPSWLDPSTEVKSWTRPLLDRSAFVVLCVDTLVRLGLTAAQACEVTGNALSETAWGERYRAYNCGGVKATKPWAVAYKARTGRSAPWWKAGGNLDSADSDTVFYRGYRGFDDFFDEWVRTFIPKPGVVGAKHKYKRTGELFWAGLDWYDALIEANYKGKVTRRDPDRRAKSRRVHAQLARASRTRYAQSKLRAWGLAQRAPETQLSVADGKWGKLSRGACVVFQRAHGLPESGSPDDATLDALSRVP